MREVQGAGVIEVEHPNIDQSVSLPSLTIISTDWNKIIAVVQADKPVYATITHPSKYAYHNDNL